MTIPDSISAMVYTMKRPHLWTLMVWAIAIGGYALMAATAERLIPLAFAACACIAFVGCMPLIRGDHNTLHWVLGVAGCVLSQVWCGVVGGLWPLLGWWLAWGLLMFVLCRVGQGRTWCFWMEVWCMAAVLYLSCRAIIVTLP